MVDLCVNPNKDSENGQLKIGMLTILDFFPQGFSGIYSGLWIALCKDCG